LSKFVTIAPHSDAIKPESPCFDACYLPVLLLILPLPQMIAAANSLGIAAALVAATAATAAAKLKLMPSCVSS